MCIHAGSQPGRPNALLGAEVPICPGGLRRDSGTSAQACGHAPTSIQQGAFAPAMVVFDTHDATSRFGIRSNPGPRRTITRASLRGIFDARRKAAMSLLRFDTCLLCGQAILYV